MPKFNEFKFNEEVFGYGDSDPNAPLDHSERIAWTFFDGVTLLELPVNPSEVKMPSKQKSLTHRPTTSGRVITYEGKAQLGTITLSGVILEEIQFRTFEAWVKKRKQIEITDDLGQSFWVYLKDFTPRRRRSSKYPWLMDYTINGVVLDRG